MLSIKNLAYNPHNRLVFNNISASFNEGEIIGITGAAGSGKSTLIRLIRNLVTDYEGTINFDNREIKSLGKQEKSNLFSHYSKSENIVNPESIVKEWILGGRIKHKKRLSPYSGTDIEIAHREMTNFGLDQLSETRLKLISESYIKMASLARVFSARSDIMLLEKPDAGLDINQKVLLSRSLKKYSSGNNIVLLTSTDFSFMASTCDRIILLADNIIAESGTHQIITGELIKKYFNVEAVVTKNIYSGFPEIQIIE